MSNVLDESDNNKKAKTGGKRMSKSRARKSKKQINLLTLIPVRVCKWSRQKANPEQIRILKPRFDTGLGKRIGKRFTKKDTFNINLDEYGTAVWRLIDGKLTVNEIGEILRTQFSADVEPLYPRLASFLRILEGQKVIEFKKKIPKKTLKSI
jgi:hypothetical protein